MAHALPPTIKHTLCFYELLWRCVLPFTPFFPRLKQGIDQRKFQQKVAGKTDIWIQAASVGESFLARSILSELNRSSGTTIFISTQTSQGYDILQKEVDNNPKFKGVTVGYFPFDRPSIMAKAVQHICPKVMVLLETEIWPGLLSELKKIRCKTIIINGRLSPKSLKHYQLIPKLFSFLSPNTILAISDADKARYQVLFQNAHVTAMPNIKFDQALKHHGDHKKINPLFALIPENSPFVVLGSVRKEEEKMVETMIRTLLKLSDNILIALVPRHLERIDHWKNQLNKNGIPFTLRSKLQIKAKRNTVILWDSFGELLSAFALAKAVFIGGTLAPLGGQNFLEALTCGITPIIGPYWDNFHWVGTEIIETGLVKQVKNHHDVSQQLLKDLEHAPDRDQIYHKAMLYFKARSGGTQIACNTINSHLSS